MKKSSLPKNVECIIRYNNEPIADLMLLLEISTIRKNAYFIVIGPSDQHGRVTVTYEEIKKQADSQLELSLMDFDPIEKAFSGEISVKFMNCDDIKNAISAYNLFKSIGWYPPDYRVHLEKSLHLMQKIDTAAIEVNFSITKL